MQRRSLNDIKKALIHCTSSCLRRRKTKEGKREEDDEEQGQGQKKACV